MIIATETTRIERASIKFTRGGQSAEKIKVSTVLSIAAVGMSATAFASSATKEPSHSLAPEDLVPVTLEAQNAADLTPDRFGFDEDTSLKPDTTRLIGQSDLGKQWVALDEQGLICVVSTLGEAVDTSGEIAGISCRPPEDFYRSGVSLELQGPDGGLAVHLLPTDAADDAEAEFGQQVTEKADASSEGPSPSSSQFEERAGAKIVVMPLETADEVGEFDVPRQDGEDITLRPSSAVSL